MRKEGLGMGVGTFRGGVHLYEGKELSQDKPVKGILPKSDLVYPMSQHIGVPAKPIVSIGDRVLVGQLIGEVQGFISSNIISSVSGTVKAIEKRLVVSGNKELVVVIENDGTYEALPSVGQRRDYTQLSKQDIRDIVKGAGIVGMGGAGFPTHVKITPKDDSKIEYVIVNGAECEQIGRAHV